MAIKEHELKRVGSSLFLHDMLTIRLKAHTLIEILQNKILAHEKVIARFVKSRGEPQSEKAQEVSYTYLDPFALTTFIS